MLFRISRLSLWLVAASAGIALFGPRAVQALAADVALAVAGIAFLLWRSAVFLFRRAERHADAVPEALPLAGVAFDEVSTRVGRAVDGAGSFEAALHAVGDVLRCELGAGEVHVFLAEMRMDGILATELIPGRTGLRAPARMMSATGSHLARAARARAPFIELPRSVNVPVVRAGGAVALIELVDFHMVLDLPSLRRLLDETADALQAFDARSSDAPARAMSDPDDHAVPTGAATLQRSAPTARDGDRSTAEQCTLAC